MANTLNGQVDQSVIDGWKKKHTDGIYGVKVEGRIGYFRQPGINDLNYSYSKTDWDKQLDKWKALADTTFIGGCEEVLSNERLFISIAPRIQEAAKGYETELVNL